MQPIGEVDTEGNAAWEGGRGGVEAWFSCGWRPSFEPQFPVWWILQHLKRWLACSRYSGMI